jgi:dTMP kinase
MPLFITFEGGEGCGKSFQSRALYRKLLLASLPAILIHEPGGTPLGEKIRRLLKQEWDIPISPLTELMLFNASRSQLVTDVIQPALKAGENVICDRFSDSTLAYQSYGRGLDFNLIAEINRLASQGVKPDITFLLDVLPETGLSRKKKVEDDRFDRETLSFHQKVREGFLALAADSRRWVVIDAALPKNQIAAIIWDKVNRHHALSL